MRASVRRYLRLRRPQQVEAALRDADHGLVVVVIERAHRPHVLQFGYLNRKHLSGQKEFQVRLGEFLERVPPAHQYALEIRNREWLNEAYFAFIAHHGLVPVLLEGHWMPPAVEVYRRWRGLLRQAESIVLRLHGPDREGMEEETGKRWNALVVEVADVVGMTHDLLHAGVDVYQRMDPHE